MLKGTVWCSDPRQLEGWPVGPSVGPVPPYLRLQVGDLHILMLKITLCRIRGWSDLVLSKADVLSLACTYMRTE